MAAMEVEPEVPAAEATKASSEAADSLAPAAAAEATADGEEEQSLEVAEGLIDWLVGAGAEGGEPLKELERLSGASIQVSAEAAVDGKRSVKMQGKAISVARARVLLEDRLKSAPGAKEEEPPAVTVAGRSFKDRDALVSHIRSLQASTADGSMLGPEDAFFVFHLATFHPNFGEKMTSPVVGFKYGSHEQFAGSKCFFVVRADGTEEGISIMKCVEAAMPKKGDQEQGRGVKRGREEEEVKQADGRVERKADEDEPAAFKPRREIQTGCVLIVEGVPSDHSYEDLRDVLSEFGYVRFVEFLQKGPSSSAATSADAK
ncbi:unnamed protein product, partial [Polarella glacialis]